MYKNKQVSSINKPNRVADKTQTCIDYIFINENKFFKYSMTPIVLKTNITDPDPILLTLKSTNIKNLSIKLNLKIK